MEQGSGPSFFRIPSLFFHTQLFLDRVTFILFFRGVVGLEFYLYYFLWMFNYFELFAYFLFAQVSSVSSFFPWFPLIFFSSLIFFGLLFSHFLYFSFDECKKGYYRVFHLEVFINFSCLNLLTRPLTLNCFVFFRIFLNLLQSL